MRFVLGIDEAGRGPLAGPVAVGLVVAPEEFDFLAVFPGLDDSKRLSEKNRERLFALLEKNVDIVRLPIRWRVEFEDAETIDRIGITAAVQAALSRGIRTLLPDPLRGRVVLDGLLRAPPEYEQETIVGGDGKVPAIMLASVAAKVMRDRLMRKVAVGYPRYGFDRHKGYGTQAHHAALAVHGPCALHRATYLRTIYKKEKAV